MGQNKDLALLLLAELACFTGHSGFNQMDAYSNHTETCFT